jgi:hypothetical protein
MMDWKQQNVRVVCSRAYIQEPPTIIRGVVLDFDDVGMKISGRLYQKILNDDGSALVERPVDVDNKVLFIPWVSMKFCEQIVSETRAEEIDRRIRLEKPIPRAKIRREGSI